MLSSRLCAATFCPCALPTSPPIPLQPLQTFLNWADATDPAGYPFANDVTNVQWRRDQIYNMLMSKGLTDLAQNMVVSEYGWMDPDLSAASGFVDGSPKNARFALTHWKSCARTLQAFDIMLNTPGIMRVYWAQVGAGGSVCVCV